MKYTVLTIFTYNDGKADKQSTNRYDTYDEAINRFHSVFGYISNADTESIISVIINGEGDPIRNEYWKREPQKQEPEVEE